MVMISRFSTVAASIVALAAVVSAELKVLSPGGPDLWWGESDLVISMAIVADEKLAICSC